MLLLRNVLGLAAQGYVESNSHTLTTPHWDRQRLARCLLPDLRHVMIWSCVFARFCVAHDETTRILCPSIIVTPVLLR